MKKFDELHVEKMVNNLKHEMQFDDVAGCVLEFALFEKDENNIYSLNFNNWDKTFSITLVTLDENDNEFPIETILETYLQKDFDKDVLINRIMVYANSIVE